MWLLRYAIPKTKKKAKKRDKKTTKSRLKISQMFLLYPQYLKLQSWFSNDFSLGFFISAIFMLFYLIVFLVYTVPVSPVVKGKWTY